MMTDPIADFLTRLRNAGRARRPEVIVPYSQMREAIAQVLAKRRLIESCDRTGEDGKPVLRVVLRTDREPLELKRMSKPGQRIYRGYKELKRIRSGLGVGLISTSSGILTDEEARAKKVGGEYLCEVY